MKRSAPDLRRRLWRARRRQHHIDALLSATASGWTLAFLLNDRVMVTLPFARREAAEADADSRLRELLRAGWNLHW